MSDEPQRLHPLGAGILRLWCEKQIAERRLINASQLAREASHATGGPVQPRAAPSIVMDRSTYSPQELSRILSFFRVSLEEAESIGRGEPGWRFA